MSKADASYQRDCDRVRREILQTAPKRPRFSKSLALDTIDTLISARLARAVDACRANELTNNRQLHDGAFALSSLRDVVWPKNFQCTKRCLRAELDTRIANIHAHGPVVSPFHGWMQCEGKDEAYCARYGTLRAYYDLIEELGL